MKCDRKTSHHCAAPISLFPPFWSSKPLPMGLWSVQGQCGSLLGRLNACGNLCKMLITLLLALELSLSTSKGEWLSHCGALDCFPGAGTKGGGEVWVWGGTAQAGLRRMCSAQPVRLLLGLMLFFPPLLCCDRKSSPNVLSGAINTAPSARGEEVFSSAG